MPIRDSEGRIANWFGTNTDITEKLELERELTEMNQRLEQRVAERTVELKKRNEELQQFAYVASHDMQEPLRKIQTFADLAKTDFGEQLGSEGSFYLERIQNATSRMSQILTDLLVFSRVATKQPPFAWTSVQDVMNMILVDLDMAVAKEEATIEVDADVPLQLDISQFRQISL